MTLTEYFNQETPRRMPSVYLRAEEYTATALVKYANEERARVYINHPAVAGIEYSVSKNCITLYTTDRDGNPKAPSVFHLDKPLNKINLNKPL